MFETVNFWKLTAAGNDFVCIDNCDGQFDDFINDPPRIAHFAHTLCLRHTGIGADGLIFCQKPELPDVAAIAARIFEWDGSEVELCGNGTACFVHWATRMGRVPAGEVKILTPAGIVRGEDLPKDGYTRVCISLPEALETGLDVPVGDEVVSCDFVITGIPHVVTYVDDIEAAPVATVGRALRHHPWFQPRGANADFVQEIAEGEIAMRTWEFGVEGETLACGTGSAASAILAARHFNWSDDFTQCDKPVLVHTRGGKVLRVYFSLNAAGEFDDLCLESPVQTLYSGAVGRTLLADALALPAPLAT